MFPFSKLIADTCEGHVLLIILKATIFKNSELWRLINIDIEHEKYHSMPNNKCLYMFNLNFFIPRESVYTKCLIFVLNVCHLGLAGIFTFFNNIKIWNRRTTFELTFFYMYKRTSSENGRNIFTLLSFSQFLKQSLITRCPSVLLIDEAICFLF